MIERRLRDIQPRAAKTTRTLVGHAAVFNDWSDTIGAGRQGGFKERFLPGAFTKALRNSDIRALLNHDASKVLGRNVAGTLIVKEDDIGLLVTIHLPRTAVADEVIELIQRGDLSQMSLAFTLNDDGDSWDSDFSERTIHEVKELFDVSVVTYPAYKTTTVSVRGNLVAAGLPEPTALERSIELNARFVRQQARYTNRYS